MKVKNFFIFGLAYTCSLLGTKATEIENHTVIERKKIASDERPISIALDQNISSNIIIRPGSDLSKRRAGYGLNSYEVTILGELGILDTEYMSELPKTEGQVPKFLGIIESGIEGITMQISLPDGSNRVYSDARVSAEKIVRFVKIMLDLSEITDPKAEPSYREVIEMLER